MEIRDAGDDEIFLSNTSEAVTDSGIGTNNEYLVETRTSKGVSNLQKNLLVRFLEVCNIFQIHVDRTN